MLDTGKHGASMPNKSNHNTRCSILRSSIRQHNTGPFVGRKSSGFDCRMNEYSFRGTRKTRPSRLLNSNSNRRASIPSKVTNQSHACGKMMRPRPTRRYHCVSVRKIKALPPVPPLFPLQTKRYVTNQHEKDSQISGRVGKIKVATESIGESIFLILNLIVRSSDVGAKTGNLIVGKKVIATDPRQGVGACIVDVGCMIVILVVGFQDARWVVLMLGSFHPARISPLVLSIIGKVQILWALF